MEVLFSVIYRLTGSLCTCMLCVCAATWCLWPWETPELSEDLLSCHKHPVRCQVHPDPCPFPSLMSPNIFLFYQPRFECSFLLFAFVFIFVKLSWSSGPLWRQWSLSLALTCFLFPRLVALSKDLAIWLVTPALFSHPHPLLPFHHQTRSWTHFYPLSSLKLISQNWYLVKILPRSSVRCESHSGLSHLFIPVSIHLLTPHLLCICQCAW